MASIRTKRLPGACSTSRSSWLWRSSQPTMVELSWKRKVFVMEYLIDLNCHDLSWAVQPAIVRCRSPKPYDQYRGEYQGGPPVNGASQFNPESAATPAFHCAMQRNGKRP